MGKLNPFDTTQAVVVVFLWVFWQVFSFGLFTHTYTHTSSSSSPSRDSILWSLSWEALIQPTWPSSALLSRQAAQPSKGAQCKYHHCLKTAVSAAVWFCLEKLKKKNFVSFFFPEKCGKKWHNRVSVAHLKQQSVAIKCNLMINDSMTTHKQADMKRVKTATV